MPDTQIFAATIQGKEELEDDYKITADIPAFKSKFPAVLYMKPEEAAKVKTGKAYNLKLEQGKLADGKSGDFLWHYRWKFAGFAAAGEEATAPPAPKDPATAPGSPTAASKGEFRTPGQMIRSDALRYALEYVRLDAETSKALSLDAILADAKSIEMYLTTGALMAPNGRDEDGAPF